MKASYLLAFSLLLGCYNPTPARFRCGDTPPICPDGVQCIQGWCGGPPPGMYTDSGMTVDAGPVIDASGPAPGCAGGKGIAISGNLYACPGSVAPGDVRKRCAAGYSIPQVNPVSMAACAGITGGFFVANAMGSEDLAPPPTSNLVCQWTGQPQPRQRYVYGCGNGAGVFDSVPCGIFPRAAHCDPGDGSLSGEKSSWVCPLSNMPMNRDFDNISSPSAVDGVLCWKP